MSTPNLTRSEIRKASSVLRSLNLTLPKVGWSWTCGPITKAALRDAGFQDYRGNGPAALYHDARGYFWGW
jgi:hypothetical protein